MIESDEFKEWLRENTTYSDAVIGDTVSRMKRADHFLKWQNVDIYQFQLEHIEAYSDLSVSVKSQIKRAVKWYTMFANQKDKQNNSKSKEKGVD